MSLPGSPNFDVLYGPLRFLSIQSDQYFDKGRQVLDAYFRDYALGRVFVMRYINDPSKFKGTIDFVLPDDVHETLEEEAKGHLTAWAARMVGENADVLVLEDDNYTLLQGSRSVVCTPTYEKVSEALKHISIPLEQVCPTGAAEWRAFVLGNWDYAYHPLRFRGEEGLFYNGLHTLLKVQEHPYVLPISRVVVDKDDNLVGWTQIFLPGGDMRRRDIIRTKWILQLLNFVDDMEARYDTQHNDLSPGNILVDPVDDDIRIIDWECANGIILGHAQVEEGAEEDKLDVECALVQLSVFSILTKYTGMPTFDAEAEDFMPSRERMIFKAEKVMALDWQVKTEVDSSGDSIKSLLGLWQDRRKCGIKNWNDFLLEIRTKIPALNVAGFVPHPHQRQQSLVLEEAMERRHSEYVTERPILAGNTARDMIRKALRSSFASMSGWMYWLMRPIMWALMDISS